MRRSLILIVSLGLNVGLGVIMLSSRRHTGPIVAPVADAPATGTNQGKTHVVIRKQYFAWSELESADYAAYIANLREIGCPEQTLRDIVIADVNQLYSKRVLTEVPTADQEWWRAEPDTNFVAAMNAKMQSLNQERRALLTTLLGPGWEEAETPARPLVPLNGPVLGELSPETKNAVQQIIARSQQRTQAYMEAQKAAGRAADPAEIARIGQQTRVELAQILTPPQLEEFLLRYSESAAALREQLRGIEVTPDEFRQLFRLSDPIEQQFELVTGSAADRAAQQAAYAKQLADLLKSVLGPDRYQTYRLAQDPLYRDAVMQAQAAGATADSVRKLYDLNKLTADEQSRIRNDASLTDDQKAAQLQALAQQKQLASDQILGVAPVTPATPEPTVPDTSIPTQVHSYSPGETIDMIAAKYGVTPQAILGANPDLDFNGLTRGAAIKIPSAQ